MQWRRNRLRNFMVLLLVCGLPIVASSCRPKRTTYHTTSHTTGYAPNHTTGYASSHTTRFSSSHTTVAPIGPRLWNGRGKTRTLRDVELIETDVERYETVLRKHRGKVILVDFWATWCLPCKASFPRILGYGRDYADNGLVVVSVSLDDSSQRKETLEFLRSVRARTDNLISKWGAGTASVDAFEIDSAVPYYKLYDRRGHLRFEFSGSSEGLDDVEPLDQVETRFKELLVED